MSIADDLYEILSKYYEPRFGEESVWSLSRKLSDRILMHDMRDRQDLQNFIWVWYDGGGVAEAASREIMGAFPDYIGPGRYDD